MNLNKEIKNCYSLSQFCRLLGYHVNGSGMRKAKKLIEDNNLDISHFDGNLKAKIKYELIEKECPVCGTKFITKGNSREKMTCSYSCSNTFFRSGKDNPNWKEISTQYRSKCFEYHKKECVICKEEKIVEVHHIDEDRSNNDIFNLVPLCPTHHKYWHSEYKEEIEDKIYNYIKEFKMRTTTQYQQQQQINPTD
jgi:hypothetical protein